MGQLDALMGNLFQLPVKQRNQVIDVVFYDVGALEPAEQAKLSPLIDLKGTIIVVSPRAAQRQDKIRHYPNALRFMLKEGTGIQGIAVAGVGSSVLGTAALARNVADHYGFDVAGIVTGYGMADVVEEALGGWFFYGQMDRTRYAVEQAIRRLLTPLPEAHATPRDAGDGREANVSPLDAFVPGNSGVGTLYDILFAGPPNLRLLVGHSKGNLLLSFVLNHMKDELGNLVDELRQTSPNHPLFKGNLAVVTLGAVVDVPTDTFRLQTHQFLGQFDFLGQLNSDRKLPLGEIAPHTQVPGVGHHLNPCIPFAMRVRDVLRRVPPVVPQPEGVGERPMSHSWGEWPPTARVPAAAKG